MNTQREPRILDTLECLVMAYGDGSARQNDAANPGPGGHAFIAYLPEGGTVEYLRHDPAATNSTQEMKALLAFLQWLHPDQHAAYHTDSAFVVGGCNDWMAGWKAKGWRKADGKPVANRDIWEQIDALLATRIVDVVKVKGHAKIAGNERADRLADEAARNWGLAEGEWREVEA